MKTTSRIGILLFSLFVAHLVAPLMAQTGRADEGQPVDAVTEVSVTPDVTETIIAPEPVIEDQSAMSLREDAHKRFLRLNDEERYEEALDAALEVVLLTQEEIGADTIELATPLVNLATMQTKNGDHLSAETNYKRCIAIIEKHEGRLSARLINPLNGLGATYNRAEQYENAVSVFERALRINHVNEGFYNLDQFKIQDGLTESHVGLQEIEDANFYQEAQLEIYERRSGVDNPEIVVGIYKLADWYTRSNQIDAAMQAYRSADKILRKTEAGKANPARVGALEGIAQAYASVGNQSASASALKSALTVIDSQMEIDYRSRAGVLVKLGDLYTRNGKFTTADVNYAEAWRDLSREEDLLGLRDEYFASPVRVAGRKLSLLRYAPDARGKARDTLNTGYVLIRYSVKSNGRVEDVQVVESEPPGIMDKALVSTFSRSVFRPRRVDGVAVYSERLLYQLDFLSSRDDSRSRDKKDNVPLEYPDDARTDGGRIAYPERAPD